VSDILFFLLLGLGVGSMYAALGIGVVVIHRGTGVVNFALGAQAMYPAVVYTELRTSGDLLLPVIGLPARHDLGDAWGFAPAVVAALAIGAVVSALAFLVIFRPLRDAQKLTQVIATVGVVIVLQGLALRSFGSRTVRTPPILPEDSIDLLGRRFPVDRLYLAAFVVALAVVLSLLYRLTRFGLATRAGAESERGAVLLGYDLVKLGVLNWMIASSIVGLVGIAITPLSGVSPFNYTGFVVPALAAALAGRLKSFGWTAAAGLLIGGFEAVAVHLVARGWIPDLLTGGLDSLVPFIVIVLALFAVGRTLPVRGMLSDERTIRLPTLPTPPWLLATAGAVTLGIAVFGSSPVRLALVQSSWVTILLLSMVVITGFAGQISLAQLAFAGFAAFSLSKLTTDWGIPFPVSPILAVAATTVVGVLIGVPALRIRGIQYAIVTFAAGLVFERLVFRSPALVGGTGVAQVEQPTFAGVDLGILQGGTFPTRVFTVGGVVVAALCLVAVARLRASAAGRRLLAVRMNERAAAAAGVSVVREKLLAAGIGSFLAAVAGVILAYKSIDLVSAGFEPERGLQYMALAYLGGITSVRGAVVGGLLAPSGLLIVTLWSGSLNEDMILGIGFAVLVATRMLPNGLAGISVRARGSRLRAARSADLAE